MEEIKNTIALRSSLFDVIIASIPLFTLGMLHVKSAFIIALVIDIIAFLCVSLLLVNNIQKRISLELTILHKIIKDSLFPYVILLSSMICESWNTKMTSGYWFSFGIWITIIIIDILIVLKNKNKANNME